MAHTVQVKLGDETFDLRFTTRSLYQLEQETGRTLQETVAGVQQYSYVAICNLVWAAVLHDPRMEHSTPLTVAERMPPRIEAALLLSLLEALKQCMGTADPEDTGEGADPQ